MVGRQAFTAHRAGLGSRADGAGWPRLWQRARFRIAPHCVRHPGQRPVRDGPLGAWLPTLYAVPVRYTGISLAFNLGGIIGGALAPFAAQMLADRGGAPYVGLFLTAAGAVTLLGVLTGRAVKRDGEPYTSALLEP